MKSDALIGLSGGFDLASVIGVGAVALALPIITEVALKPVFESDWYRSRFGGSDKNKFIAGGIFAFFVLDSYGLDLFAMTATSLGHPAAPGSIGTAVSAAFLAGGRNAVDSVLTSTGIKRLFTKKVTSRMIDHEDN
jgi:hypothetical protein